MFATPYDIANRGLQLLGQPRIASFADSSKQAKEMESVYDKLRRNELRRFVWTFATRRMILRPIVPTTKLLVPLTWAAATFSFGDVVADTSGMLWISNANSNTDNPNNFSAKWTAYFGNRVAQPHDVLVNYLAGDVVWLSTTAYLCVSSNINQTPPNATYWHPLSCGLSGLNFLYPAGYLPSPAATPRTLFYLPANHQRIAPQDPKKASNTRQQTTAGMQYNDWEIEGNLLSSAETTAAFVYRFVSDFTDVSAMDDMFCEGLGSSMGRATCETFTQSEAKKAMCDDAYMMAISAARAVSSIEGGSTEEDIQEARPQRRQQGQ